MEIIDLNDRYLNTWMNCLEDWSEEMAGAGDGKKNWYEEKKDRGLRVKLAIENETAVGMIQYIPVEESYIKGEDLYFIYCIWVHGHKQGMGNQQNRGIGKALLAAAEEDARELGASGIAAWGLMIPVWMKASWYRKKGYKPVSRNGIAQLMWKPFTEESKAPQWIKQKKKPADEPGKVVVTTFYNGWCQVQNINKEKAKRIASRFPGAVEYREINTSDRKSLEEWGIEEGVFVDNRLISTGPPLSEEKIEKIINQRIRKKKLNHL